MALIAELRAELVVLRKRIAELEKENAELRAKLGKPPKTPDNSSVPPSLGRKASGQPETKRKGKRKSHPGAHRALHPNPTHKLEVKADYCEHCQADVSQKPQMAQETYDHIEIPPVKPIVTQVTLMAGLCPCCGKPFKAKAPEGLEPGSPFGPNLRAKALYLRYVHGVSFERLAHLFSHLFDLEISEGALVNMIKASRDAFTAQAEAIRQALFAHGVMASDETTARVGKKNWWMWVFHHDDSAVFKLKPSRGKDVVEEFLGDYRPGYWISDRYGSQIGWATKDQQFCLAHLIRDAQYAIDAGDKIFASGFKGLLQYACVLGRRRDKLRDSTLKAYAYKLEARLDKLMALTPKTKEGQKLQIAIKGCRRHLFVFMTNRALSPTNNGSERSLRPAVIFRKITNCFRSEWGAEFYADIRSVIETGRRRGIDALQAIWLTLRGEPLAAAP
jgi:transposase